jgi:mannose/cellobiose epimerase-like protein (N-acyl-D-glucosamine 2-epimerase family)
MIMGIVEGTVERVPKDGPAAEYAKFSVRCKSGDLFDVYVGVTTNFNVVQNLDGLDNDRIFSKDEHGNDVLAKNLGDLLRKTQAYVSPGWLIAVTGVWQVDGDSSRFDSRAVWLLSSVKDKYVFEETHWWLTQTARLADQWLDSLFGDRRTYELDDFVKLYNTDLNILGLPVDDTTQECAVLSRLIYGFSAAFLVTGQDRYRQAAAAGVAFLRDSFRSLSHDGAYCFWAFGRRKTKYGTQLLVPSASGDDSGSIPLYEQIYALAGLTHYYRISLDPNVLEDIARTMHTFNAFFLDEARENDPVFTGKGGWFSHIDYATLRPDNNPLPENNLKKNWNSVGDHIPAYLINLIIMLDPLPDSDNAALSDLLDTARDMLKRSTELILEHFTDPDPKVPYINERFLADWTPDHTYAWQQNRAIVGHNFKIAWNLTRVANYCDMMVSRAADRGEDAKDWRALSKRCMDMADRLGRSMTEFGVDLIRGGCFDAVERNPQNGQKVEFTWLNTKDFWQQEQAILAYLILFGHQGDDLFLDMARRTEAFWNLSFLDRDHRGIFFRVSENGLPILDTAYGVRGGHSDASGYHCFELAYLAHIYNRAYVAPQTGTDASLCLYFHPQVGCDMKSINVMPDFVQPGRLTITAVRVAGDPRRVADPHTFQIELGPDDLGCTVAVEFAAHASTAGVVA